MVNTTAVVLTDGYAVPRSTIIIRRFKRFHQILSTHSLKQNSRGKSSSINTICSRPVPTSPLNCFLSCKIINNLWHEQSWEVENVLLCTIITLLPQREEAAALIKPEVYVNRRVKVAQICYITSWNFPIYFVRKLFLLKCWSWRRSTFQQQE